MYSYNHSDTATAPKRSQDTFKLFWNCDFLLEKRVIVKN